MIGRNEFVPIGTADAREPYVDLYRDKPEMLMRFLKECRVFSVVTSNEQLTLRNYAIRKLEQMGLLDELKLERALVAMLDEKNVMDSQPIGEEDPYKIYQKEEI